MKKKINKIITVKVTQKDIKLGIPASASSCPVARALSRVTGDKYKVSSFFYSNSEMQRELPPRVVRFIDKFDGDAKVKPFNFKINIE